jgi:endonuclease YncB( thermonuclease family)
MSRTLFIGLLGGCVGGAVLLVAVPADLFGRVPVLSGRVAADANEIAVIDGQTLRLRDGVLRLQGVVAPPRGQTCQDAALGAYDCGAAASSRLAALIRGQQVVCTLQGRDEAGLPQARCAAGEIDLNGAMSAQPTAK